MLYRRQIPWRLLCTESTTTIHEELHHIGYALLNTKAFANMLKCVLRDLSHWFQVWHGGCRRTLRGMGRALLWMLSRAMGKHDEEYQGGKEESDAKLHEKDSYSLPSLRGIIDERRALRLLF